MWTGDVLLVFAELQGTAEFDSDPEFNDDINSGPIFSTLVNSMEALLMCMYIG